MEQTFFIVKPEVFERREEIKSIISKNGLLIRDSRIKRLTLDELSQLGTYDVLYQRDKNLFDAYVYFMQISEVEIGIIEGDDAVMRYKKLCGLKPNPVDCNEGTLRRMFGLANPGLYCDCKFFLNGIHKSDNHGEAKFEIAFYNGIF